MITLPEDDDELLAECELETFRSSGPGGQHVNKTESGVRLRHLPSGIVVTSRQERSQHRNKVICIEKLRKLVERLNYTKPERIKTVVPGSVRMRDLAKKKAHSDKKRLRTKPIDDSE